MDKSKFTANPELDAEGFPRTNEDRDHQISYLMELRKHGLDWNAIKVELVEFQQTLDQLPAISEMWTAMIERKMGGFTVH